MSVEVAHNDGITSHIVQKPFEVGTVSRSARRIRRNVDVVYGEADVTEMEVDGLEFEMRVSANNISNVNRRELHIMADEEGEAPSTTSRTIAP